MGYRIASFLHTSVLALAALTLIGCAASGDRRTDSERFALADSESALGYEQSDWQRPFWERWAEQPRAGADADRNAEAPTAVATRSVTAATAAPAVQAGTLLRPQLGIYLDEDSRDSTAAYQIVNALDKHAEAYGMTVVKPAALTDALSDPSGCAEPTDTSCRQTLAVYPGVRALLILRIQEAGAGGETRVETRMADTDFGVDYDPMTARLSLNSDAGAQQNTELSAWSRQILDLAADRIAIAPWFTHSFAREGNSVYVSAGPRSGLRTGTVLAVHGEGSIVRAPGGGVVGWNPGPVIGRLEVRKLIGQRAAVAESVSGEMPLPRHRLTVVEEATQ